MIRFLCCHKREETTTARPRSDIKNSKVVTRLTTISNTLPMTSFPKSNIAHRDFYSHYSDMVEWSPKPEDSLRDASMAEREDRVAQGVIIAIGTKPANNRSPHIPVHQRKVVSRHQSFSACMKNAAGMGTLAPSSVQLMASISQNSRCAVKRTVSFNVPANRDIYRCRRSISLSKTVSHSLLLMRRLERDCSGPAIVQLVGQCDLPGELSTYDPLSQLDILKFVFEKPIIDSPAFFDFFFQRCQQIANQWPARPVETSLSACEKIREKNFTIWLEIPALIKSRAAFQLQGELWVKFCMEIFGRGTLRGKYAVMCRDIFSAMKPLWHEYQNAITRLILLYFSYIPQQNNQDIFFHLTRLCEQRTDSDCYENIRLLAENIIYLDKTLQYEQAIKIKDLSSTLHFSGKEKIYSILSLYLKRY